MSERKTVAVVGATGYGGAEAVRLLLRHPGFRLTRVTSGRLAGRPLREACPWLDADLVLTEFDPADPGAEFVLLAQENGFAARHAPTLLAGGARVVDLSADHRLRDADAHRAHYGAEPPAPIPGAVYGLPEIARDRTAWADAPLVANPGCHATAAILALHPLRGMLTGAPVVDSFTGVSGAGRARTETEYLFAEATGSARGYATVGHRHTPEIEQAGGRPVRFSPILAPMARGILATVHAPVSGSADEVRAAFDEAYRGEPFVRLVPAPPATKATLGTNLALIHLSHDARLGMVVVSVALDNLGKGAAGAAVQNLNLLAGLPEAEGLPTDALWP